MPNSPAQRNTKALKELAAIDQLLVAGIKQGPAQKKRAMIKVLQLVPAWTRRDCWQRIRHLRRTGFAGLTEGHPKRGRSAGETGPLRRPLAMPWAPAHYDKLLNLAGYEPVNKIAHRLGRSERSVRFRLGALGMSAKVTDGWSLRTLQTTLRVRRTSLRQFIGIGMLRVRDPRVSRSSLATFCDKNHPSLDSSAVDRVTAVLAKGEEGYTWERAASLLGVTVAQVQGWISAGQLRVLDTFVTDKAFGEFCKNHGGKINTALMDPQTARWLISEYGVPTHAGKSPSVSRARKQALVIRACRCGRRIAGNAYFRHIKSCLHCAP